jgi:hypothetical protein
MFCYLLKEQDIKSDSTKFTYCELVGTAKLLSNKITVEIDYGLATKFFSDRRYKYPATGKPILLQKVRKVILKMFIISC